MTFVLNSRFVGKPEVIVGGAFVWRFCTQSLVLIRLNGRIAKKNHVGFPRTQAMTETPTLQAKNYR